MAKQESVDIEKVSNGFILKYRETYIVKNKPVYERVKGKVELVRTEDREETRYVQEVFGDVQALTVRLKTLFK